MKSKVSGALSAKSKQPAKRRKRNIITFEADPDVLEILRKLSAECPGSIGTNVNLAIRDYHRDAVQSVVDRRIYEAEKSLAQLLEWMDQLKKLKASFPKSSDTGSKPE